jgi:hypothetical protein
VRTSTRVYGCGVIAVLAGIGMLALGATSTRGAMWYNLGVGVLEICLGCLSLLSARRQQVWLKNPATSTTGLRPGTSPTSSHQRLVSMRSDHLGCREVAALSGSSEDSSPGREVELVGVGGAR